MDINKNICFYINTWQILRFLFQEFMAQFCEVGHRLGHLDVDAEREDLQNKCNV